jgi:hypothetical protein
MELDLPTPVSRPLSLEWHPRTAWRTQGAKVAIHHLEEIQTPIGGHTVHCAGAIQGKEGGIQVLAGLAPCSQTVGSNKRSLGATINVAPNSLAFGQLPPVIALSVNCRNQATVVGQLLPFSCIGLLSPSGNCRSGKCQPTLQ